VKVRYAKSLSVIRKRIAAICYCFFLFLLLLCQSGFSQSSFKLNSSRKRHTISFSFHRNLIIIPLFINNKGPYNFLLDTGVGMGLITNPNLMDSLGLAKGNEIKIVGAGENQDELKAYMLPHLKVNMDGIVADDIRFTILSEDVFNLSSYVGLPISGILGHQFFNSFVVRINFIEQQITLYEPSSFKYKRSDGASIPFQLEEQRPYLYALATLQNQEQLAIKLIIDTGASHAISLEKRQNAAIKIPEPAYRTHLGWGLNGSIKGYIGRVTSFQLNKYKFKNILSSFPDHEDIAAKTNVGRNGNLGNEVLKRFHVIIDYSRSRLTLKPNAYYRKPFEHDMSGLDIVATGSGYNRYFVSKIEDGSAAAAADILPGDEIVSINARSAKDLNISTIDDMFQTRNGLSMLMILRREGKLIYRILTLKRRI